MADKKPSNRERIKEIVTGIEANIQDLFQSDKFADYLRTMSRFHSYSYNNTILIHMQMPSATHVAGFNKWKNQFGRHVKKGEKGLTIIAPTPFKKRIEEMKLDPDTRAPVLDHDGNVIMEEREVEIPLFRPVKVFDVSQTEGRPLPSLVSSLTGDVQQYEAFMEALRRTSPVSIMFKPLREGLDGFLSLNDQTITIREGMSQVQTVCAAVHEITHAMLHNREREQLTAAAGITDREPTKPKDKNTREVEAESVSYTVCQYYGIETSANSLGYIATWSKDRSLSELKASLETISKTANILITSIDRHFQEICKEQGIDLTAQQPEQDAPSAAPDTLEQFAADLYDFMDQLHQEGVLKHPFTQDPRERSIADLVIEMRKGYFEGVRGPLNYLIEHTGLILTDLTKAKTLLARLDGLVQTQDAPAAELPPDTPERFISDMLDMLDRLYQAGLIKKNFPPDNRDRTKANLVRTLQVNPSIVRATLEQFVQQNTGAAEAKVMLDRLDGLVQSVPLKEYVYKMEANPRTVGAIDQQFIQAYERTAQGTLKPDRVLFFGTADKCAGILKKLQSGELKPDDFFQPGTARISHYKTKDGAELDAFVGPDDKVYMGRRDHYDNRGHYLNADKSLLYLSNNTVMFDFVSGSSYAATQAELLAQGCFTMEDYAEFDALRVGVLAQFEQVGQLLFAGEPFSFIQPDAAEQEPPAAPIPSPPEQADEALYLLDDSVYLQIQASDEGWDYTLYTKHDMAQLDGGQLDAPGRYSRSNKDWARTVPIFDSKRSIEYAVNSHPVLVDAFLTTARHEHLLSLPLTKEDIKAEALNILCKFQDAREPNSPNGTYYMAQVSPDFLARAGSKDTDRLMSMLPFQSLSLSKSNEIKGNVPACDIAGLDYSLERGNVAVPFRKQFCIRIIIRYAIGLQKLRRLPEAQFDITVGRLGHSDCEIHCHLFNFFIRSHPDFALHTVNVKIELVFKRLVDVRA